MRYMSKLFGIIAFLAFILLVFATCDNTVNNGNGNENSSIPSGPEATSLRISPTTRSLPLGDDFTPTFTVVPSDAPIISWVSANSDIVTVNNEGLIVSKGLGKADITVTAKGGLSATCTVTVTPVFATQSFVHSEIEHVAYGGGRFVGGGYSGKVIWSEDGIDWTAAGNSQFGTGGNDVIYRMAYGNGIFVAVGRTMNSSFEARVAWSDDGGVSWTLASGIPSGNTSVSGVVFDGNQFFASSATGVFSSTDGKTWEQTGTPFGTSGYSVGHLAYGNGKLIAIRNNSYDMAYSEDGAQWTVLERATLPITTGIVDITFGNGKFVVITNAYSEYTDIIYSDDGITWHGVSGDPFFANFVRTLAYGEGIFFAGGTYMPAYSSDGITWVRLNNSVVGEFKWMAIGGNKIVSGHHGSNLSYAQLKSN